MATTPSYRPGSSSGTGPRTAQTKLEARLQDAFDQRYLYMVPGHYYHNDHFYAQTSGLGAGGARGPTLNATLRQGSIVLLRMNSWSDDAVALIARRDTDSADFEPRLSENPDRGPPRVPKTLYSDWTLLSNPFNLDGSQILQACGHFMDSRLSKLPATHKLRVIPPPSTGNTPRTQTIASYKYRGSTRSYSSALDWPESSPVALNSTLEHPAQLASALEKVSSGSQRSLSRDSGGTLGQRSPLQSLNNSHYMSRPASNVPSNRGSILVPSTMTSGTNTPRIPHAGSAVVATHSRTPSVALSHAFEIGVRGLQHTDMGASVGQASAPLSRQQSSGDLAEQNSATMRSRPALSSNPSSRNRSRERQESLNDSRSRSTISGGRAPSSRPSSIFIAQQTVHMPPPLVQTSATSTRHSSPSGAPARSEQQAPSWPVSSAGLVTSAEGSLDRVGRFERTGRESRLSPSSSVDSRKLAPRQSRPDIGQQLRARLDMTRGWERSDSTHSGSSANVRTSPSRGPSSFGVARQHASPSPLAAPSITATATNLASNASQYANSVARSQGVATARTALNTGLQTVNGFFNNLRRGH